MDNGMTPDVLDQPAVDRESTSVSDHQQQQASRRRRLTWIIGLAVVVLGMGWLIHHRIASGGKQQHMGRGAMMGGPMPVSVGKVSTQDVPVILEGLGTVTPLATVQIRPEVTGYLVKIDFQEGQIVKAGQVLAQIDPRPYQAALDSAQGQLQKDQATLAGAGIDLARYKRELQEDAVAAQTYTDQIATVHEDQAAVSADKASIETAQLNLNFTRMTSPVTGLVGLRQVDIGNLLQANQSQQLVTVTQMQPMSVLFSVPENDLTQVFEQLQQGQKLVVQAWDRTGQTLLTTGTLSSVDNQINTSTGTLNMRAMFDNKDLKLYPDEFVNIKLVVTTLKDQVVVPGSAVENGPSSNFVYILKPDRTVTMRTVVTGPTDGDKIAITSGLAKPGDPGWPETVVTDGADQLREGAKVLLPGDRPAAGFAGAGGTTAEKCTRIAGMMKGATGTKASRLAKMYSRLGCSSGQKPSSAS